MLESLCLLFGVGSKSAWGLNGMWGVIIEPMPGNGEVQRNANSTKDMFRVVLVEQDEMEPAKKGASEKCVL